MMYHCTKVFMALTEWNPVPTPFIGLINMKFLQADGA